VQKLAEEIKEKVRENYGRVEVYIGRSFARG